MPLEKSVRRLLPAGIAAALSQALRERMTLQVVRLRRDLPVSLQVDGEERLLGPHGFVTSPLEALRPSAQEIADTLSLATRGSLYAVEDQLRRGYLALPGGHRLGVSGQVVVERGELKTFGHVTGLHLRIAHEVKGCATDLVPRLSSGGRLHHTLIIGPPGAGKTTVLRDLVRLLADGSPEWPGCQVAIVDERAEISGAYDGRPQLDVGERTDVLVGCPKATGMLLAVRALGPEVVATDEIGAEEDVHALADALRCGITLIATAHGTDAADIRRRPALARLLAEGVFERLVVLSRREGPGTIERVVELGESGERRTVRPALRGAVAHG